MNTSETIPGKTQHMEKQPVFLYADLISVIVILIITFFKTSLAQALASFVNIFN